MRDQPKLTLLERTKVQAEVLVPLIHAMEDELGREQAHRLVRQTLGGRVRESIRAATPSDGARDAVESLIRISMAGGVLDTHRLD